MSSAPTGPGGDPDDILFDDPDLVGQKADLEVVSSGAGAAIQAETLSETEGAIGPLAFTHPSVQRCPLAGKQPGKADDKQDPEKTPRALELGIFFDGTNNNLLSPKKTVTNVGRLFGLYRIGPDPEKNIDRFALYVRGVGSLDEDALHENARALNKALGEAKAKRGEALVALLRASDPNKTGTANIQSPPELVRQYNDADDKTGKLEKKIAQRRQAYKLNSAGGSVGGGAVDRIKIAADWIKTKAAPGDYDTVTIDVFGFSRGAATARSFINGFRAWTKGQIEDRHGKTTPKMSATTRFLGIFDTVAAFELTGRSDMTGHNLDLGNCEARVFHITAADEFRYNFKLTPAGVGEEISISGAHADIGGGYDQAGDLNERPSVTGKTYEIGDLTLAMMHEKALASGAPFKPLSATDFRSNAADRKAASNAEKKFRGSREREMVWNTVFNIKADKSNPHVTLDQIGLIYKNCFIAGSEIDNAAKFVSGKIHFSFIFGSNTRGSLFRAARKSKSYNIDEMSDEDWDLKKDDGNRAANFITTFDTRRDTVIASPKNHGAKEFIWYVIPEVHDSYL